MFFKVGISSVIVSVSAMVPRFVQLFQFDRVEATTHHVLSFLRGLRVVLDSGLRRWVVGSGLLLGRFGACLGHTASLGRALERVARLLHLLVGLRTLLHVLLMAVEHTGGKSFQDPGVTKPFIRVHSLKWVPLEATTDQIYKLRIRCLP